MKPARSSSKQSNSPHLSAEYRTSINPNIAIQQLDERFNSSRALLFVLEISTAQSHVVRTPAANLNHLRTRLPADCSVGADGSERLERSEGSEKVRKDWKGRKVERVRKG